MNGQVFSKEFWRLGHRRPWWQWNVITLFVPLFLLVWVRELLRVPQGVTWLMSMAVLAAWFLLPMILLPPSEPKTRSDSAAGDKASTAASVRPGYLISAMVMFVCVMLVGGIAAGVFSILAAMLYAAAVNREQ
jgi:hypothetical protein